MAFGHSILAMSGEESLAQVNREIEHPKLKNLKRAAIVIAIYSLIFTGGATLLASMLIPNYERTHIYADNLIAGLAMFMAGPLVWRILFRVFVVLVGFLILSGAINTSMIGSTGVLKMCIRDRYTSLRVKSSITYSRIDGAATHRRDSFPVQPTIPKLSKAHTHACLLYTSRCV